MLYIILGIIIVLAALLLFMVWPGKTGAVHEAAVQGLYGYNCAHRGLHTPDKTVPENSMAAFRAAAEAGYGMELDIQLSRDGEVVVFHDDDLDRVCGVHGRVDSFDWKDLQQMPLEGTAEHMPLFADFLAMVDGRVPLIVELKMGPRNAELCEKALAILRGYKGHYCVESFDPRIVRWFKKRAPDVLRGQLSATAKHLESGLAGFLVGNLLTNFLARPHFIAYDIGPMPLPVRFARGRAVKVAWTATPQNGGAKAQQYSDAVIFEFYEPEARYKTPS